MMTFNSNQALKNATEAYVWVWLPMHTVPTVAGRITKEGDRYIFVYGKNYRESRQAIALSPFELPLISGRQMPMGMNYIHSVLRDAAPDAWGRRLIEYQYPGFNPNELDFLLLSGSNRIGGLDFQLSATQYKERAAAEINLQDVALFAEAFESDQHFSQALEPVLLHGTSVGGARPKCLIKINQVDYLAKFSLSIDYYPILKAEFVAMKLAKLCGLNTAEVELSTVMGRDILLIKRFDRINFAGEYQRKLMLSGLSLLGLNEMEARYASYQDLADIVRQKFIAPKKCLKELFSRLVFNILIGNTDDHARNHAAFWDGASLELTPAYDICPQQRIGQEATQAMALEGVQGNFSTVSNAISICERFLLSKQQAQEIVQYQIETIKKHWDLLCDEAGMKTRDRDLLFGSTVLSDFSLQ